jgi:hypothetical protein
MWILLNNKPVLITDITAISKIITVNLEQLVPSLQKISDPNDFPYYCFIVTVDSNKVTSKKYKTIGEADEKRNELMLFINRTVASLPSINI